MGSLIVPDEERVYFDANALIYRVEKVEPFYSMTSVFWESVPLRPVPTFTSTLTLLEVLVKPVRDGDLQLQRIFRDVLLQSVGVSSLSITRPILERAAQLRAAYHLRTPDAIHAATAIESRSGLFLTNDVAFRKVEGLNVAFLTELAGS